MGAASTTSKSFCQDFAGNSNLTSVGGKGGFWDNRTIDFPGMSAPIVLSRRLDNGLLFFPDKTH